MHRRVAFLAVPGRANILGKIVVVALVVLLVCPGLAFTNSEAKARGTGEGASLDRVLGHSSRDGDTHHPASGGVRQIMDSESVAIGATPTWTGFDPVSGDVYVVDSDEHSSPGVGSVSVVRNASLIANISIGEYPLSAAIDTVNGLIYVTNYGSDNISVISGTSTVAQVSIGFPSQFATFDPQNGFVYVLDAAGSSVAVLNGTDIVVTLQVGSDPSSAAYDPATGFIYVGNDGSSNLSVINGTQVIGQVKTGGTPGYMAYDSVNGYLYVPIAGPNVSVVAGMSVVAQLSVGSSQLPETYSALYDNLNGYVYVIDSGTNQVTVITGLTVLESVAVGSSPLYATLDSSSGEVYVPDRGSNAVSILNGTNLSGTVSVGKDPITAVFDPDFDQVDVVAQVSNALDILRLVSVYDVLFVESGLQSNASWAVTLTGFFNLSNGTTVGFQVPNGTFTFSAEVLLGYTVSPQSGSVVVAGANLSRSITYTLIPPPPSYPVTFTQSVLPTGTIWWIQISGAAAVFSSNATIEVDEQNGTYQFTAGSSDRQYAGSNGTIRVDGSRSSEAVTFQQILFTVSFVESGLPSGTPWSVTFDNEPAGGQGTINVSDVANGTYAFVVPPEDGDNASPSSGQVRVEGSSQVESVQFIGAVNITQPPPNGAPPSLLVYVLVASIASIAVLGVVFLSRRRRGGAVETRPQDGDS
jgi:DNA-binding beta-propeller fold protein YncE